MAQIQEDLSDQLEAGFSLAYFILRDERAALKVLLGAVNKYQVYYQRETKRSYWRDKYLKRHITRIAKDKIDSLQWLIYYESSRYEKQSEESGLCTPRDIIVRYIKELVRLGTAMSSFYVSVGLQRLLYNYTTAEAARAYELITGRYIGSDEYRRAKGLLMKRLELRFSDFVKVEQVRSGERRFVPAEDQKLWGELVNQCLTIFTPWSTKQRCSVLSNSKLESAQVSHLLSGAGHEKVDQDVIEINRCHVFIDPHCYAQIAQTLGLDPPNVKVALPQVNMTLERHDHDKSSGLPVKLGETDRNKIMTGLSQESARRLKAAPRNLRILADGEECGRLDLDRQTTTTFQLVHGTGVIEVWTEDDRGELLVATFLIGTRGWNSSKPEEMTAFVNRKMKLNLTMMPPSDPADDSREAIIKVESNSVQPAMEWLPNRRAAAYAFAGLLLVAIGWFLGSRPGRGKVLLPQNTQELAGGRLPKEQSGSAGKERSKTYRLVPAELAVRGTQDAKAWPTINLAQTDLINLELAITSSRNLSFSATLSNMDGGEVMRENSLPIVPISNDAVVKFVVPSAVLKNHQDYLVELYGAGPVHKSTKIHTFTFRTVGDEN